MQFTGLELTRSRSIYTQNLNFGWALDCAVDNTTGRYEFGVSGDAGALAFTLQSGRILAGNTFLHNYAANERFYLECQVTSNTYNLLKDDVPLLMGAGKVSGNYTNLYFHREEPTLFADFNFFASGQNLPNVTIDTQGYLLTTGQNAVTGQFQNLGSYPARVFGSEALFLQGLDFGELAGTVAKQSSGQFAFTGDFSSFDFANPILVDFQTNFENARVAFTITDARSQSSYVYFDPIGSFAFNNSGVLLRNLSYSNYSGGFQVDSFPAEITFRLSYVSGSGIVVGGDAYTTTGYGSFAESGLLTGLASTITGDIVVSAFGWATGAATGAFTGFGTGYGTGVGYSGVATGIFTGYRTGFIYEGSGSLLVGHAVGLGVGLAASEDGGGGDYATGITASVIYLEEGIYGYDPDSSNPYIYGFLGSGSPEFVLEFGNYKIYWESGEDILYGMSGMASFGITGFMSGTNLYLAAEEANINGNPNPSAILYIDSNRMYYPGTDNALVGAHASGTATGYIDLSSPYYTDSSSDLVIYGRTYPSILQCIYRPKFFEGRVNIFTQRLPLDYVGVYTDAGHLASGINSFTGVEVTGNAVGDTVYLTARDVGTDGNDITIEPWDSSTPVGYESSEHLYGGSVSTHATGYIRVLPPELVNNAEMNQYGGFYLYSFTGGWYADIHKYNSPGGSNQLNFYYQNASDVARMISGSFVSDMMMTAIPISDEVVALTSVIEGVDGTLNYHYGEDYDYEFLAEGGGGGGGAIQVTPIGPYTGNLTSTYILGSGNYNAVISQSGSFYYKTFTGSWDLLTGLSYATLQSAKRAGTYTDTSILVTGSFPSNGQLSFQISHISSDDYADGARLQISGARVLNGIDQFLSQP